MKRKHNQHRVVLASLLLIVACSDDEGDGDASGNVGDSSTSAPLSTGTGSSTSAETSGTGPSDSASTGAASSDTSVGEASDSTGQPACDVDVVELADAASGMHPEGIAYDPSSDTLYVGGFITGDVLSIDPCSGQSSVFAEAGSLGNVAGLRVDPDMGALWVCASDFGQMPPNPRVTALSLDDGEVLSTHAFGPGGGICNDLTLDGDGNLYLTDSFANRIVRLSAEDKLLAGEQTETVSVWSADAAFGVLMPGTFGLNGIAWDGEGVVTVAFHGHVSDDDPKALDPSHVYRVPIEADGAAGPAEVLGDLPFGDGLQWFEATTFLVNEQSSIVSLMSLEGGGVSTRPIASDLDFSTTSAVVGSDVWVVEGQLDHFLDPSLGPAPDPFVIRRFPLPE